jgi:integrase
MLTETEIRRMPAPTKTTLTLDSRGLYLRTQPTGAKSWVYRSQRGGKWRVISLGAYPKVGLAAARNASEELRAGALPENMTFARMLDKFYADRVADHYKTPLSQVIYITYGKKTLGNKQVSSLTTRQLVEALQDYAKTSPVAANRCLSVWNLCFNYAVELGLRESNPLSKVSIRSVGGSERERDRVLSDEEIKQLWTLDGLRHRKKLQFLLLTGLRVSEPRLGHIDGDELVLPAEHSKNGREHRVHLTPLASEVFEPFTVTAEAMQKDLNNWQARHAIKRWTAHDLRRTFATRCAGIPNMGLHVVEKLLNHKLQGVLAVYNQHDYWPERVDALEKWSALVKELVA